MMRTTLEAVVASLALAFALAAPAAVVAEGLEPAAIQIVEAQPAAGSPADVAAAILDCEADCMSVGQSPAWCAADCTTDDADGVRQ